MSNFPIQNKRTTDHAINSVFTDRWSPRSLSHEAITEEELLILLEAARWAPSSFNAQPWRFAYALRGDALFQPLVDSMAPVNQLWAPKAAALVAIASFNLCIPPGATAPISNGSHAFDAGAAWANMALQATFSGWCVHAMGGIDFAKASAAIGLPAEHQLHALIAIGKRGDPSVLPDALRERELPNSRKPIRELAVRGKFL
jgi:nitroreductase